MKKYVCVVCNYVFYDKNDEESWMFKFSHIGRHKIVVYELKELENLFISVDLPTNKLALD